MLMLDERGGGEANLGAVVTTAMFVGDTDAQTFGTWMADGRRLRGGMVGRIGSTGGLYGG